MQRTLLLLLFSLLVSLSNYTAWGQTARDTLSINGVVYNYVKLYANGKVKEAGNYDAKNKLNGKWISFDKNGLEIESGSFINDKKDGEWWYHKSEIIWYNQGKVIKKGSGCKDCPGF